MSVTVQFINTGSSANAGNGDSLRTAFNKINANFLALSTSSGFTLGTATNTTLGGVKIGIGLVASADGTISATGASTSGTIFVLDQTSAPSVDIVSYSGSTTLSTSSVEMFTFDKTIYRSATIDVSARNVSNSTNDVASAFNVTWNSMTSNAWGLGAVAMNIDGNTGNAEWDLECSNLGNNIRIKMRNASGLGANGHVVDWRAKVNLFRL